MTKKWEREDIHTLDQWTQLVEEIYRMEKMMEERDSIHE